QLYVDAVLDLDEAQKNEARYNIQAGVNRLKQFQTSEGGFGYWPGDNHVSEWGNNYAGHFLLEAQQLGYSVPSNLLNLWKKSQNKLANSWTAGNTNSRERYYSQYYDALTQAYRLYTLALAKSPNLGAMNRLRESGDLPDAVRWRLAAAYALAGQQETAVKLIEGLSSNVEDYQELGGSYGSSLRDEAMFLETMVLLKRETQAAETVREIAGQLEQQRWYSTQTTAYSLLAIGKYIKAFNPSKEVQFSYTIGSQASVNAGSNKPVFQIEMPADKGNEIKIKNNSGGLLYIRIIQSGQPIVGDQTAASNNLVLELKYMDTQGNSIDPGALPQGTDFIAQATIRHPGQLPYDYYFEQLALHQVFPSGWEIINSRMDDLNFASNT
ncbi:MAG: alpha-2-macroglobulin, partial [Phaeodactylibacter sp.]|nr:alpha-2-macroglobulin [Phaeodactylibacter sp.]